MAQLRILATTDIHMQLVGHDYVSDRPMPHRGLAGLATLIAQARAQAKARNAGCILLDNGDMFQGNIIGELLASDPVTASHPIASCLNTLAYDAIGLGNHDLDFGMAYLRDIAAHLTMPLVSTNLDLNDDQFIQKSALIDCALPGQQGKDAALKVGVISVLPAKTEVWNRHVLADTAQITDPVPSLIAAIAHLKAQGAQVIVLLAHMGMGGGDPDQNENALTFAGLPGIDAVITGHTHQRFPGRDHQGLSGVDTSNATLAHRPAIMPGNGGSDLAVLDLTLTRTAKGEWAVADHACNLRSNTAAIPAEPKIQDLCMPAHHAVREILSERIGQTASALHNYFSLAMPTPTAALSARAKARVIRKALIGTADADTPLLASASAHTAGGRGGPDHYLCIPQGPVYRRHIAGLSPYANQICALRINGGELHGILERTAAVFRRLQRCAPDQLLIDNTIPAFNFDTVFGVTYQIDPTQSVGQRISDLQFQGRRVTANDHFILATNQFRAAGGGGIIQARPDSICLRSNINISDALIDALRHPSDAPWQHQTPWTFGIDGQPLQATLNTAPAAQQFLADMAHLSPIVAGTTADGFLRITLDL